MKYVSQRAIGVRVDAGIAAKLGFAQVYSEWDGEDPYFEALLDAGGDACAFQPDAVRTLTEEKGGYVTGLTGFASGVTYLHFDPEFVLDPENVAEWNAKVEELRGLGVEVVDGSWNQLM